MLKDDSVGAFVHANVADFDSCGLKKHSDCCVLEIESVSLGSEEVNHLVFT